MNWSILGPILEREGIQLTPSIEGREWIATHPKTGNMRASNPREAIEKVVKEIGGYDIELTSCPITEE